MKPRMNPSLAIGRSVVEPIPSKTFSLVDCILTARTIKRNGWNAGRVAYNAMSEGQRRTVKRLLCV